MGAVTSILTVSDKEVRAKKLVNCIVVDSSFSSLEQLIEEYAMKVAPFIPNIVLNYLKKLTSEIIMDKAKFKIEEINPLENVKHCGNLPAIFCHGLDDNLINNIHSQNLYNNYSGKKEIILFQGSHNTERPHYVLQIISLFFYENLDAENYGIININSKETIDEFKTFANLENGTISGKFKDRTKSEKFFSVSYKYFNTIQEIQPKD